ncbi:MAG TPA: VanZ family protein [Nitrospira sp.]|nr:VanZ family protein [Nitrospira sp.]
MDRTWSDASQGLWPSFFRYWAPVIGYASLIFYFSSLSHPEERLPDFLIKQISDKLLHLAEYGVLSGLCYRAFRWAAGPSAAGRAVLLAILVASAYALTDEVHQWFVPLREASWMDWVADTIGAAIGAVGWSRFMNKAEG